VGPVAHATSLKVEGPHCILILQILSPSAEENVWNFDSSRLAKSALLSLAKSALLSFNFKEGRLV